MRLPYSPLTALTLPLRLMPVAAHSHALAVALNRVLREALAQGELDFLDGRCIAIEIEDIGLRYRLGLVDGRSRGLGAGAQPQATIAGGLKELLLLAARREDADTLFFARRLRMSGDTELGLHLKNFLDAFEPPNTWQPLFQGLGRLADLSARVP
ncbi:MAG: ubiquinone anaerobic biosynthesis accessory factor UbiT [Bdellovibrio bacteriovorus]